MKKNKITMIVVSLFVLITVVYGFIDGGSPQAARNKKYDDKRIEDIQTIKNWVNSYYRKNKLLPPTVLESFKNSNNGESSQIPIDPETNIEYGYQAITEKEYKICGSFSTDTKKNAPQYLLEYSHPTGPYCLIFDGTKY